MLLALLRCRSAGVAGKVQVEEKRRRVIRVIGVIRVIRVIRVSKREKEHEHASCEDEKVLMVK